MYFVLFSCFIYQQFEKFVKENDAKRERANAKITLEKKLFSEKVKQIKTMTEEIVTLGDTSVELHSLLSKNIVYKAFLTNVIEGGYGYGESIDLRYK